MTSRCLAVSGSGWWVRQIKPAQPASGLTNLSVYLPHVGQVGKPVHVSWNRVEIDEKSAEQQNWDWRDGRSKHRYLDKHIENDITVTG